MNHCNWHQKRNNAVFNSSKAEPYAIYYPFSRQAPFLCDDENAPYYDVCGDFFFCYQLVDARHASLFLAGNG
jgi:hypothetical protein